MPECPSIPCGMTLQKEEANLKDFYDLKEKLLILFEGKPSRLFTRAQQLLRESSDTFALAEKVFAGTYVQHLAAEERQRRETRYVPNGMKFANGGGIGATQLS